MEISISVRSRIKFLIYTGSKDFKARGLQGTQVELSPGDILSYQPSPAGDSYSLYIEKAIQQTATISESLLNKLAKVCKTVTEAKALKLIQELRQKRIPKHSNLPVFSTTGLTFLGAGGDSAVYQDPEYKNRIIKLSPVPEADAVQAWYKFCAKYPSEFYPKVYSVEHVLRSTPYVKASIEKLSDISKAKSSSLRKWYDALKPSDFKSAKSVGTTFEQALLFAVLKGEQMGFVTDLEDPDEKPLMSNIMKRGSVLVISDPWREA